MSSLNVDVKSEISDVEGTGCTAAAEAVKIVSCHHGGAAVL